MGCGERLLLKGADAMQADLIAGMLEDEGIPFYVKAHGAGTVYGTGSMLGVSIYVAAAGYERSKELLDAYCKHQL